MTLISENNFYGDFKDTRKAEIKDILEKNKWQSRKISREDFEFKNSWSELILEGDELNPILHGILIFNEENIETLNKIFENLKGDFHYEIYSKEKIIFEKRMKINL